MFVVTEAEATAIRITFEQHVGRPVGCFTSFPNNLLVWALRHRFGPIAGRAIPWGRLCRSVAMWLAELCLRQARCGTDQINAVDTEGADAAECAPSRCAFLICRMPCGLIVFA
jgi:hypothetical protein